MSDEKRLMETLLIQAPFLIVIINSIQKRQLDFGEYTVILGISLIATILQFSSATSLTLKQRGYYRFSLVNTDPVLVMESSWG